MRIRFMHFLVGFFSVGLCFAAADAKKVEAKNGTKSAISPDTEKARIVASGSVLPDVDISNCRALIESTAMELGSAGSWIEQAPKVTGSRTFRTPTKQIGNWLEIEVAASGAVTLYTIGELVSKETSWNANCATKAAVHPGLGTVLAKDGDTSIKSFTDTNLEELLAKNGSGVIYVWSPGMSFSAKFLKAYRAWAKSKKMDFAIVVDPRATMREVLAAENTYGFSWERVRMNSVDLYMRSTTIHFPTALVFKDGRIHRSEIVGVMSVHDFESEVQKRLSSL